MSFLGIYRAVYDYAPQAEEELEIHDGDLLFALDKSSDDGWWKCKKKATDDDDDEPEGLVPNNYVEQVRPTHTARALYDYTKQTDEELSFKEDARLDVYDQTDPDWTLVGSNGQYGFAPAIYIDADPAGASNVGASAPPAMPPRPIAADEPIPGEADYIPPSSPDTANNPASAIANIISHRTGGGELEANSAGTRALASPPPSAGRVYTPEDSEDEEAPPPKPARPPSQSISSISQAPSPARSNPQSQYTPSASYDDYDEPQRSRGGYHLYNIHEMVKHMGKSKKLPMTLGINVGKGVIMIAPEKSKDGPQQEWTAEKMMHYSIEGKHVFVELVRPSKSVDFHAGAKDTAAEIVAHLGELAGASRLGGGLGEVYAAARGLGGDGMKKGQMLYEFMAQGDDEVSVAAEDEVLILDDTKSEEWWLVRRLKDGKEGVVPSSYVEVTGTVPRASDSITGLDAARSTIEQNRLEEERLTRSAARKGSRSTDPIPERGSSLSGESGKSRSRDKQRGSTSQAKSKPNQAKVRTWTDRSGTFKVEAEFIGLKDGKIHLHKMNGVKIAVPVAKMAVDDLEYVERATGVSLDEDKPLSDVKRRSTQKPSSNGAGATVEKRAKDEDFWFDFFLQCGVNYQICSRYASAFAKDQMSSESLPDINAQLLRTLGLKEGDNLRVMKFLDSKYGRQSSATANGGDGDQANGGLFTGPGGVLKNNTRKGRPAPAVQTNDEISEDAFKSRSGSTPPRSPAPPETPQAGRSASTSTREVQGGFDDDAWSVKPARTKASERSGPAAAPPQEKLINDDIASLVISTPALQPTLTAAPSQIPAQIPAAGIIQQQPTQSQQPQGANKEIFDKIASLAPARQRPQAPAQQQQQTGGALGIAPPQRASSAPGFQPQQSQFAPMSLQPQLTGYGGGQQISQPTGYQQQQSYLQPQQTSFQAPQGYAQQGYQGQQVNGYSAQQHIGQPTGVQAMQQNFPALQPQPTGMNFQPQSQFGQQQQSQQYGVPQVQPGNGYQQQLVNGTQTGSPFADPPRQPYQPGQPSNLQSSFTAQPTGLQQMQQTGFQQQPSFNMPQPTGVSGYQAQQAPLPPQQPNLPPQQTGGVFGPSQSTGGQTPAPLVAQKTGPPPPVRFGVQPGQTRLMPQPTGRANLANASKSPFKPGVSVLEMIR